MNKRTLLTLFVSLFIAGIAAYSANTWISDRLGTRTADTTETIQVVAAAVDIPMGSRIQGPQLKMLTLPADTRIDGSFRTLEDVVGKVTPQPVFSGEILVERRLADDAGGSPLAAVIEPGRRAMTVRVDDVIGVAGFLTPGSRVDVVGIRRAAADRSSVSKTLIQNLKVLAVDQTVATEKNEPIVVRAVTLEVSPKQAETLGKATTEGKVQLTLRNPKDVVVAQPKTEPAPAEPAPRRVASTAYRVDVIRGTEISRTSVR
jgi:pilus assembly protein CpaB